MTRGKRGQRLVNGLMIAVQSPLHRNRYVAQPLRLRRCMPFPPPMIAVVEQLSFHYGGKIGWKTAPPTKRANEGVVVADQPELHLRDKILNLIGSHAPASADRRRDLPDERQVLEQELAGFRHT